MAQKNIFLTVSNLVQCIGIFKEYMSRNYSVDVEAFMDEQELKETFYNEMTNVKASPEHALKDLNNLAMNAVKAIVLQRRNITRPNVKTLDRDQSVYGQRQVTAYDKPVPMMEQMSTNRGRNVSKEFEHLVNARNQEGASPSASAVMHAAATQVIENAIPEEEFQRKVKEIEEARDMDKKMQNRMNTGMADAVKMNRESSPKDLYQTFLNPKSKTSTPIHQLPKTKSQQAPPPPPPVLIPPPKPRFSEVYISINSTDRDWNKQNLRYKYVVDFASEKENAIGTSPRDIESIKVSFVILPSEIFECRTNRLIPKVNFQHEFSFGFPYILLRIDELANTYDGTNNEVRNCFCKLIFDKMYKTPNGRGYTVLKPMQDERKTFYPNRLASIQQMTISFLKPNGTLFNQSADDYRIYKIEHEVFNPMYLKIVTDKYFDKNEFFVGDHVNLNNFDPFSQKAKNAIHYRLCEFINRREGHDVIEIGQANESGFYNTFYILAPGVLDQKEGKLLEDKEIIDMLNHTNASSSPSQPHNGDIINVSLQNVIAMKFSVTVPDASVFATE